MNKEERDQEREKIENENIQRHQKMLDMFISSIPINQTDGPKRIWVCDENSKYINLCIDRKGAIIKKEGVGVLVFFSIELCLINYQKELLEYLSKNHYEGEIIWRTRPWIERVGYNELSPGYTIRSSLWVG